MAATATLARPTTRPAVRRRPRSFAPPGDRSVRLSHLDPRPLWREEPVVESPWKSPSFWLAWALVAPVARVVQLLGR